MKTIRQQVEDIDPFLEGCPYHIDEEHAAEAIADRLEVDVSEILPYFDALRRDAQSEHGVCFECDPSGDDWDMDR